MIFDQSKYLTLTTVFFFVGLSGIFLFRKNILTMLLSIRSFFINLWDPYYTHNIYSKNPLIITSGEELLSLDNNSKDDIRQNMRKHSLSNFIVFSYLDTIFVKYTNKHKQCIVNNIIITKTMLKRGALSFNDLYKIAVLIKMSFDAFIAMLILAIKHAQVVCEMDHVSRGVLPARVYAKKEIKGNHKHRVKEFYVTNISMKGSIDEFVKLLEMCNVPPHRTRGPKEVGKIDNKTINAKYGEVQLMYKAVHNLFVFDITKMISNKQLEEIARSINVSIHTLTGSIMYRAFDNNYQIYSLYINGDLYYKGLTITKRKRPKNK